MAAADVRLEGTVFPAAIIGRDSVFRAMRASASLYTRLAFVYESLSPARTYMEWEAEAFGLAISGLTALTIDAGGWLTRIALHHRPRGSVERFSAELEPLLVER